MELKDIKDLAAMARLDMTDQEMGEMAHDFEGILAYVDQIKEATGMALDEVKFSFTNVVREDTVTNESGVYTDKIVAEFPDREGGYLKVKQIL